MLDSCFGLAKKVWGTAAITALVASMSGTAVAQQPSGRTELIFLGTAGGPPLRLGRSEPATLLIVDGHSYLIDCGIGDIWATSNRGVGGCCVSLHHL